MGRQASFKESREILGTYGILVEGHLVSSAEEAVEASAETGFPVVLKLLSPEQVHKTDAGLVILGIEDEEALLRAYDQLLQNAEKAGIREVDGVLVQGQAPQGLEVLVGASQDPLFGPLTMIGLGGRYVELFRDVWPGVGVLERSDVERMLSHTRAGRIIDGFRGPPLDKDAIVELTMAVSRMMEARPDIVELDLNPVILYEHGYRIVDARVILGPPVLHPKAADISHDRITSLENIFRARSVAVVGASRPGTVGGIILKNSSSVERLYPINPRRKSLLGMKCYPDFESLPEVPDVAVFAVAPERTITGFQRFCELGGKGAVIVSDGFAESGRQDLEDQLVEISRKHDVVYIGPNGLGAFDNWSGLNTLFLPRHRTALPRHPGPVGIISQSGGLGIEQLEMAAADDLPVGKWVSVGNASGVSIPELLTHMGDDPRIRIIAIYIEGLTNGLQFMQVAKKVARHKPIIVIKGGMAGGAEATQSHTASLAGSFEAFKAACDQAGIYLLEELTEDPKFLINILSILTSQKPARGRRAAVVSVGGGAAITLSDQLTAEGMVLADFTPESKAELAEMLLPRMHGTTPEEREAQARRAAKNPLDLFGDADDERLLQAIRVLNRDPNIDLVVMALYFHVPYLSEYLPERLAEVQAEMTKPLVMSLRGYSPYVLRTRDALMEQGVHCYTVPMVKPLTVAVDIWQRYGIDFSDF